MATELRSRPGWPFRIVHPDHDAIIGISDAYRDCLRDVMASIRDMSAWLDANRLAAHADRDRPPFGPERGSQTLPHRSRDAPATHRAERLATHPSDALPPGRGQRPG